MRARRSALIAYTTAAAASRRRVCYCIRRGNITTSSSSSSSETKSQVTNRSSRGPGQAWLRAITTWIDTREPLQDIGRHWNRKRSFHRLILFHRGLVRLSVSFMSSGSPPAPHISKAKLRKLAGYERCALLWHRSPIPLPSSLPGSAISMMRRHKMGTASSSSSSSAAATAAAQTALGN